MPDKDFTNPFAPDCPFDGITDIADMTTPTNIVRMQDIHPHHLTVFSIIDNASKRLFCEK